MSFWYNLGYKLLVKQLHKVYQRDPKWDHPFQLVLYLERAH